MCPLRAASKGPIAAIRSGDIIQIDIPARTLNVRLTDHEIQKRISALPDFEPKITTGYAARYARLYPAPIKVLFFHYNQTPKLKERNPMKKYIALAIAMTFILCTSTAAVATIKIKLGVVTKPGSGPEYCRRKIQGTD